MSLVPRTATFLGLLFTFGCAGGASDPLALYPSAPEGLGARVLGTLEREGACLYLKSESGERWLAAFPSPGTAWHGESAALALGKTTIRLGEKGSFDGGELRDGASAIAWIQPPSKECEVSKIWLVTAIHGAG